MFGRPLFRGSLTKCPSHWDENQKWPVWPGKQEVMRYIGIQHRRKKTAEGEARPTIVAIEDGQDARVLELETETDELDFVRGRFPVKHRAVRPDEDLSRFAEHHIKWRKRKEGEEVPEHLVREVDKQLLVADKVPAQYDGLHPGDVIGMVLGGSGDRLAFALSRVAVERGGGAGVFRIPPFVLLEKRGTRGKDEDAQLLCRLVQTDRELFFPVHARDRALIWLTQCFRARQEAMKARIGCEQRLRQRLVGAIFCSSEGQYPEGVLEDIFAERRASDKILQGLIGEEAERLKEMTRACEALEVYQRIFEPVQGVGPAIATRIIVAVGDIRRFKTPAKLKKFLGVHVLSDEPTEKQFPRRRQGQVANWHPDGRQALYLLADQANRRPDSYWGKKLREYKVKLREKHLEPVTVEVYDRETGEMREVKRYSNGHVHKMALWRTVTKFVEQLHREWWALEREQQLARR